MKTAGIIAEYNPFHNGHSYHIRETRRITGADYIIVVMSGDFCQRGIPAISDKYLRAEMALENGADLVLELPVRFSTASAEFFAYGAITILNGIGVTDALCFGSECSNISALSEIADILLHEPDDFKTALKEHLKNGFSYPKARELAILSLPRFQEKKKGLSGFLSSPNNILAIEYLKALKKLGSPIRPYTILRRGAGYHDLGSDHMFSSAAGIRAQISRRDTACLSVPESVSDLLKAHDQKTFPVFPDDFSDMLHYRLLLQKDSGFAQFQDSSDTLSDKIKKRLYDFESFSSFAEILKSKEVTHSRISRLLTHILLDLKTKDLNQYMEAGGIGCVRILGFREDASQLLTAMKKRSALTLLSRLSDADTVLSPSDQKMMKETVLSSHIYQAAVSGKFGYKFRNEFSRQFLKL